MSGFIEVLEPVSDANFERVELAPRLGDLSGRVVGFLENGKPNAGLLLSCVEDLLRARLRLAPGVRARKPQPTGPCPAETADDLAGRCDAVVVAVAD